MFKKLTTLIFRGNKVVLQVKILIHPDRPRKMILQNQFLSQEIAHDQILEDHRLLKIQNAALRQMPYQHGVFLNVPMIKKCKQLKKFGTTLNLELLQDDHLYPYKKQLKYANK